MVPQEFDPPKVKQSDLSDYQRVKMNDIERQAYQNFHAVLYKVLSHIARTWFGKACNEPLPLQRYFAHPSCTSWRMAITEGAV